MAVLGTQLNLSECKPGHIGPILLGRFLEQGFLRLDLSPGERKHLTNMLKSERVAHRLANIIFDAAARTGLRDQLTDWKADSNNVDGSLLIWDLTRVQYENIA